MQCSSVISEEGKRMRWVPWSLQLSAEAFSAPRYKTGTPSENNGLAESKREMEFRATDAQLELVEHSIREEELRREGAPKLCRGIPLRIWWTPSSMCVRWCSMNLGKEQPLSKDKLLRNNELGNDRNLGRAGKPLISYHLEWRSLVEQH